MPRRTRLVSHQLLNIVLLLIPSDALHSWQTGR